MTFRPAALIAALATVFCLATAGAPAHAQLKPVCAGSYCTSAEVGPFMQNISKNCGDVGTCDLCDIEIVVVNIGNWILGIVGSLVLLFYVWGGVQFLASGSGATNVKSGKQSIKTATIGLVIVFAAYALIHSIAQALGISVEGGTCNHAELSTSPNVGGTYTNPATCSENIGAQCGLNKVCAPDGEGGGVCLSRCDVDSNFSKKCISTDGWLDTERSAGSCVTNLCPEGASFQCCNIGASSASKNASIGSLPLNTCTGKGTGYACLSAADRIQKGVSSCSADPECLGEDLCCAPKESAAGEATTCWIWTGPTDDKCQQLSVDSSDQCVANSGGSACWEGDVGVGNCHVCDQCTLYYKDNVGATTTSKKVHAYGNVQGCHNAQCPPGSPYQRVCQNDGCLECN